MLVDQITKLRKELSYTQLELSHDTGVSLAFIQRIEYGTANPSLDTLQLLLSAFGYELVLVEKPIDWDLLAAIGVPITSLAEISIIPTHDLIAKLIRHSCRYLLQNKDERKKTALEAWLLAVKSEYPTFFDRYLANNLIKKFLPKRISGQHIKLKRLAVDKISRFL